MRVLLLLLWLVHAAMALMEAVGVEGDGWYKVYLIERLLYPDDPDQWKVGKHCSMVDRTKSDIIIPFTRQLDALGLPRSVVTIAEFMRSIGTSGTLGNFGRRAGNPWTSLAKFRTTAYTMSDVLDELRYLRHAKGSGTFRLEASSILDHPEFPRPTKGQKGGKIFAMDRMHELVSARGEELRLEAAKRGGAVQAQVERWIRERAQAMIVENMWRRADQVRRKIIFADEHLRYGPHQKWPIVPATPRLVMFPDGARPEPDPLNPPDASKLNGKKYPDLETTQETDWDKTLTQGGDSEFSRQYRKKASKAVGDYAKTTASIEHMKIIIKNDDLIPFHLGERGKYFECRNAGGPKRRSVLARGPAQSKAV